MLQDRDVQGQLPPGLFSTEYLFGSEGDDVVTELLKLGEILTIGPYQSITGGNEADRKLLILMNGRIVWEPYIGRGSVIAVCPVCSPVVFGFAEVLSGMDIRGQIKSLTECKILAVSGEELNLVLQNRAVVCFTACKAIGRLYSETLNLLQNIESRSGDHPSDRL